MKPNLLSRHNLVPAVLSLLFFILIAVPERVLGQSQKAVTANVNSSVQGYYEWLPKDYATNTSKKYPVLIFLHGLGEIGNGSQAQLPRLLRNGPPKLINEGKFPSQFNVDGKEFSFIVISPQFNNNARNAAVVESLIDYTIKKYRVDPNRIYLSGLSMGGGISWIFAGANTENAKRLAAMYVVCGNTQPYPANVKNIASANLPVKTAHNSGDPTVPSLFSINWVKNLNSVVPKIIPAALSTVFNSNSHDAWSKAYDPNYKENGKNAYEWMLSYSRSVAPVTEPPAAPAANQKPTSIAGSDITLTLPTNGATLNGKGTDSDGTIASYKWSKTSGPSGFKISNENTASPTVSALTAGSYTFRLTVTDNKGATATDDLVIIVNNTPANQAPVAKISTNAVSLKLPANSTTLDGSPSYDPDGSIKSFNWKYVSGPSKYSLTNSTAAKANVSNLEQGNYKFALSITDDKNSTSSAEVTLNIAAATTPAPAPATADCGCNVTLKKQPDGGIYANGPALGVKPGDVVCIPSGTYPFINLSKFNGTKEKPITIKNCGGQVLVVGRTYGISLSNSTHFKFSGTGDSRFKYGIKVNAESTGRKIMSGMGVSYVVSDFEINNVEITRVGGAGIIFKTNPTCDPMTWKENYTMRNAKFHDIYIHDIVGEGFYVGITSATATITCDGKSVTKNTQMIENVKIYDCITDGTGWDGIQVTSVPVGAEVYNNTVLNYGTENKSSQQAGIIMGGTSSGKVYNNTVRKGTGTGLQIFGVNRMEAYNNVLIDCGKDGTANGQDGIFVDQKGSAGTHPGLYVKIINNTIVNAARTGIRVENTLNKMGSGNEFHNNLIVAPRLSASPGGYLGVRNGVNYTANGNVYLPKVADAKFVNPGGNDYRLQPGSPAIDAGVSITAFGIATDLGGLARAAGKSTDAGAYEYLGAVTNVVNKAPVADAGQSSTITLPTNTVNLIGSKSSDADGTIKTYKWSKISGPASANIVSSASVNTAVNALTEGVYVFELQVTDEKNATSKATVSINVLRAASVNQGPIANAGTAVTLTLPVNSTTLDATKSVDNDGTITGYKWTKLNGPTSGTISSSSSAKTAVTNLVEGTYNFELVVTDNRGAIAKSVVSITVKKSAAVNQKPTASAGAALTITLPINSATLNGTGSKDNDGTITSYKWSQVSGPASATIVSASSINTEIRNLAAGTYTFQLTVTDNTGLSASSNVNINVKQASAANISPVAVLAATSITIAEPQSYVKLDASKSYDPDGTITTFHWTKTRGRYANIRSSGGQATDIIGLTEGAYEFRLTVTDNKGAQISSLVAVTVRGRNANARISTEPEYREAVIIYPNPVKDVLNYMVFNEKASDKIKISISDATGKLLLVNHIQIEAGANTKTINVHHLKQGMYTLSLMYANGIVTSKKFVKE